MKSPVFALLAIMTLAVACLAGAQQPAKIPRIGYLQTGPSDGVPLETFRRTLQEYGYVEGKHVLVMPTYFEGNTYERLVELAEELVRLKVDIIVTSDTNATQAAKRATTVIPIVMVTGGDPVGAGLVESLARPGGNITGVTTVSAVVGRKRLELLKEVAPQISPVAVLWSPSPDTGPGKRFGAHRNMMKELEIAARALSLHLLPASVRKPEDFESAFAAIEKGGARSLIVFGSNLYLKHQPQIAELVAKHRMPAIYPFSNFVDAGGLMSYGPNLDDLSERAAYYVDRILKGAKPAELPVEGPSKFELVINLTAAKQIGLKFPKSVLTRVDRVVP